VFIILDEEGKSIKNTTVVTLTDYDADGMNMAKRTRTETPRIGVTRETVTWLQQNGDQVTEADVQEEYSPTTDTDDEYLKDHRIELDSIVAKVGAEAFWKYIMYQLQQPQFSPEGFDYNRVDVMPANEVLYLENISNFLSYLNKLFDELLEEERGKIEEDQKHIKNLVTLEDKIAENQKRLDPIVAKDKNVKLIVSKIIKLLKLLPDNEDFISN
jgi:hypothetical protein